MKAKPQFILGLGLALLGLLHALWLWCLKEAEYSAVLAWGIWLTPGVVAYAATALADVRRPKKLALVLAVMAAVLTVTANGVALILELPSDFPTGRGAIALLTISLVGNLVLCTVGAALGTWARRVQSVA